MASALRSSARVSLAVMASRVLGVAREAVFSRHFGANWLTDAYWVAFRIPNLLRDLFAEGALSSAFVPTFTEAMAKEGRERAFRLGNLILTGALLVTGALAVVGVVFAGDIVNLISGGFKGSVASQAAATRLAQVMMPILTLVSLSAVLMGMLNAQKSFGTPAVAPALFNVVSIAVGAGLFVTGVGGVAGMLVWALGTTLGAVAQGAFQVPALWRLGWRPRLEVAGLLSDPGVRRVLRLMAPAVVGLAAIQINIAVNTYFAQQIDEASQTYLSFAFRLFYLPIGLFGVALGTVTTSRVADEAARGDRQALATRAHEGARAVWLLALPSAVGLIVLAEPVVALIYEGRKFLPEDTQAMVPVVRAYMLGVVPYSLVKVYAPAFYSVERPRVPLVASLCAVAANLAFNALTYRRLGAAGIALGTTLAAVVNLAILRASLSRTLGARAPAASTARELGALALGSGAMGLFVWALWLGGERVAANVRAVSSAAGGVVWAAALFATIGVGFVAYSWLMGRLLHYPGADELARLPQRLLSRLRGKSAA